VPKFNQYQPPAVALGLDPAWKALAFSSVEVPSTMGPATTAEASVGSSPFVV